MKTKTSKRNHNDTDNFLYEDWPEPAKSSDLDSSDASSEKVSKKSKKRKKKRDSSSDSDSDQSEKHSHKKRKHKKKKKKHSKKKRHVSSDDSDSESDNDPSSEISEEDSPPVKRKHKHKHKHSSKRKPENEKNYTETATVRPDERDVKTHKLKSICKEKEPFKNYHNTSVEHVISSDEENDDKYSKSKRDVEYTKRSHHSNHIKIEISPEGTSSKHHSRLPRVEPPEPDSSHDQYYNRNSSGNRTQRYNSQGESFGQPQQKFNSERVRDRYDADKLPNQQQYFDNGRHNDGYHKYRDNRNFKNDGNDFYNEHDNQRRQSFDGRYQNNKFEDRRVHNDRYQGNSFNRGPDHSQGERFVDHRQGNSSFNRRPQNNNYQQQPYNRDNNRQDGGYQRNKDYQHRNEHGGNRYQDKNDFPSTSQQFGRRYDDRNVNERKNSSKEDSLPDSTSREMRDDRSGTRKKTELSDHKPDTDREDREESATRRKKFMRREKSEEKDSYEWGKKSGNDAAAVKTESNVNDKEKPNFGLSGKLTEDTNMVNGVVIKYSEPPEARQPKRRWRFYPFKGEKALPILYIHRQSCFLLGRDRKVTDIPLDHPSISKQHAALQYRLVPFTRDDGSTGKRVRPYIIDLGSANGTFVNNKQIESSKYVELLEKDVVKFGFSQREYVLLHENSKEEGMDDDDVNITAGGDDTKPTTAATAATTKTSIKREN